MAKVTADIESTTTAHERAQEDLKNLLNRGGTSAHIGDGSTEPGDPAGTGTDNAATGDRATAGATGGHGDSLSYGGAGAGSRYGETTGLVGYDIGSGKSPQEMNTPPSAPRDLGKTEGHHEESGPETSRGKG
jgi:hypothetical protein